MEIIDSGTSLPVCPHCQATYAPSAAFCGACGRELTPAIQETARQDVFEQLQPTLLFYFLMLLLLATYKFTPLFPEGLEGMATITILITLITTAFWMHNIKELKPVFSFTNVHAGVLVLTLLGAVAGSVIVSVVANAINVSINDDVFYSTYLFEDTQYPFLFAVLFIAVQPAIFEEVAFRGFLFNNLKQIAGATSAVYITGFLFGIMHLQIISLLWLVPLGLAAALLRNKYNTLWYGIVAHFTYNLCVTIYDFEGWFQL